MTMKHVGSIHLDSDQILVCEIRKQIAEMLKLEYGNFDMFRSGTKLINENPASFYQICHFDTIFIVPQIMSIESSGKDRSTRVKSLRPKVNEKDWFEDLDWRKRRRLRPVLDMLRIAKNKEQCYAHASNLHIQSALFLFSSRGIVFHSFFLEAIQLLTYQCIQVFTILI